MKTAMLFIIMMYSCCMYGQNKRPVYKKKVKVDPAMAYHDSAYSYWSYDTLRGKVSYEVGNGIVKGEGIIVTERFWQCHTKVYDNPRLHDSLMAVIYNHDKDSAMMVSFNDWGGCMSMDGGLNYHKYACIKTQSGWLRIREEYIFIPD